MVQIDRIGATAAQRKMDGSTTELIVESLRHSDELPSFVNKIEFPKEDDKLLKEFGINAFDHRIKSYDLRGI